MKFLWILPLFVLGCANVKPFVTLGAGKNLDEVTTGFTPINLGSVMAPNLSEISESRLVVTDGISTNGLRHLDTAAILIVEDRSTSDQRLPKRVGSSVERSEASE